MAETLQFLLRLAAAAAVGLAQAWSHARPGAAEFVAIPICAGGAGQSLLIDFGDPRPEDRQDHPAACHAACLSDRKGPAAKTRLPSS